MFTHIVLTVLRFSSSNKSWRGNCAPLLFLGLISFSFPSKMQHFFYHLVKAHWFSGWVKQKTSAS